MQITVYAHPRDDDAIAVNSHPGGSGETYTFLNIGPAFSITLTPATAQKLHDETGRYLASLAPQADTPGDEDGQ